MELDDDVCLCFHVSRRKLENHVRVERPRRVSEMSLCGGAGTGCGWCRRVLAVIFDEINGGSTTSSTAAGISPQTHAAGRAAHLRNKPPEERGPEGNIGDG